MKQIIKPAAWRQTNPNGRKFRSKTGDTAVSKSRWKEISQQSLLDCYRLTVPVVVDGVAKTPQSRLRSVGREFYDTFQFNYITLFSIKFKWFLNLIVLKLELVFGLKCTIKFGELQGTNLPTAKVHRFLILKVKKRRMRWLSVEVHVRAIKN